MANLPTSIIRLAQGRGSLVAYRMQLESGGYRSLTWKEHGELTARFASFLQLKGIAAGDRVVLAAENSPEWSVIALAVMRLGAVLVPVAAIAQHQEILATIRNSEARFCIFSSRVPGVRELANEEIPEHVYFDAQTDEPLFHCTNEYSPLPVSIRDENADATALLIFTSGTTGHPKAVPLTHANILANAEDVLEMISLDEGDAVVSVLPLSHMFEFTCGFLVPTLAGATVTYVKSLKPEDLLRALRDSEATLMIGVPLLFEMIARSLDAKISALPAPVRALFRSFEKIVVKRPWLGKWLFYPVHAALGGRIRFFASGGSRLQPHTYERFASLGIQILQGYGLTETSPVLSGTRLGATAPDHVGPPMRKVQIGIFSESGERLAAGQEGEIWAKGPSVFSGYLDSAHNKEVFAGEWFRTGDLGVIDSAGLLRITGRKKDIIVTGAGKNVYPEEIESLLMQTGKFFEATVLGLTDASGHEQVCAVVYPDPVKFARMPRERLAEAAESAVRALCSELSEYKRPGRVVVVDKELPKTLTRKVKKHEVRKQILAASEGKAMDAAASEQLLDLTNDLERAVAQAVAPIAQRDPETIRRTDQLGRDLGLDSLTTVEVISAVEREFGKPVGDVDTAALATVEDLVLLLRRSLGVTQRRRSVWFTDFSPADNQAFWFRWPRLVMNLLLKTLLKLFWDLRVEGWENVPAKGAVVFTPNHSSHFDTLAMAGALPLSWVHRVFPVAAKDYFFNGAPKALVARTLINAIPFDRRGRVDESLAKCREALAARDSLVIFPEGTRSPDGSLQPFKPGVGNLLAGRVDVQAVPVWIEGAHEALPKGRAFPRRSKLRVRFGSPVGFAAQTQAAPDQKIISERLRREVEKLACRATS